MATTVQVAYKGKTQSIALFPGLQSAELSSILQAVFSVRGQVVGFLSQVGLRQFGQMRMHAVLLF